MLKKVLSIILSASCLLATASSLSVSADETIGDSNTNAQVFVLNEEDNSQPPALYLYNNDMIATYSKYRPSINDVRDLKNGSYIGVIQEMSHLVYTNCCFTVASQSIYVSISGDELLEYLKFNLSEGYYTYYIKFTLYEYENALSWHEVDSYQLTPLPTTDTVGHRFSGLNRNSKYFIKIEKSVDHTTLHSLGLVVK